MNYKVQESKALEVVESLKGNLNKNTIMQFISPRYLMRNFGLSKEEIVSVYTKMQEEGLVKPRYTLRCSGCARVLGRYEVLNQVPEREKCIYCGEEDIERLENVYINFEIKK